MRRRDLLMLLGGCSFGPPVSTQSGLPAVGFLDSGSADRFGLCWRSGKLGVAVPPALLARGPGDRVISAALTGA